MFVRTLNIISVWTILCLRFPNCDNTAILCQKKDNHHQSWWVQKRTLSTQFQERKPVSYKHRLCRNMLQWDCDLGTITVMHQIATHDPQGTHYCNTRQKQTRNSFPKSSPHYTFTRCRVTLSLDQKSTQRQSPSCSRLTKYPSIPTR